MSDKLDYDAIIHESRPRVYLLWAALTGIGYTTTHYYQNPNINYIWFVLALIGLGYMYHAMPLRVHQMKNIFRAWLFPITIGILISIIAVRTDLIPSLIQYLGVFWLIVQAVGFTLNGLVDAPGKWYFIAAGTNVAAAAACYLIAELTIIQYLIAAVVTAWSMLMLVIFRSDA